MFTTIKGSKINVTTQRKVSVFSTNVISKERTGWQTSN